MPKKTRAIIDTNKSENNGPDMSATGIRQTNQLDIEINIFCI